MEKKSKILFIIAQHEEELGNYKNEDVLFVDGNLKGYKAYDHHLTGDKINLDTIPPKVDCPKIVATTQLDTDAICSAVVVYFGGVSNINNKYISIFRTASHYCDYLIPDENSSTETNQKGLGLHLALKEKGFNLLNRYNDITNKERSEVFTKLSYGIINIIKQSQELPNDTSYLCRIQSQIQIAKESIIYEDELITVIESINFIDPIASYQVIKTPLLISKTCIGENLYKYSIGVNPKFYNQFNIKYLFSYINDNYEKGWGGRNIAGGCPFSGTTMPLEKLIKIIISLKNEISLK